MNAPLVTISSAFYNTGPLLLDMVRSAFAQTFADWELILIDDGSTDDSLRIAQSIQDPRIRVYSNGKNLGRSASLNRITDLARGKYIARMDSDDLCSPHRIQKQVNLLESNSQIDVAGTGMCYLDKNDLLLGYRTPVQGHEQICAHPNRTFHIAHGTIMGKKTWFEKFRYNEKLSLAIDFNLFLRSYRESVFDNVPDILYYYRFDSSFNLKKQYIARRNGAAFLFTHNWKEKRYCQAMASSFMQYVKLGVTLCAFASGFRERLMSVRFNRLDPDQMRAHLETLKLIRSIELILKTGELS